LGLFAGIWKLALVASLAVLFFGRSHRVRSFLRALAPNRPRPSSKEVPRLGRLGYIILVVTAATAVATWIIIRLTIVVPASPR